MAESKWSDAPLRADAPSRAGPTSPDHGERRMAGLASEASGVASGAVCGAQACGVEKADALQSDASEHREVRCACVGGSRDAPLRVESLTETVITAATAVGPPIRLTWSR